MKDYTKFMNYALFTMIDRKTQDAVPADRSGCGAARRRR